MNATELKSQLECPICYTIPSCNVLVCCNGHRICLKCFSSLGVKRCPQSRCVFDDPPRRNRDLESIIERGDWARACPWPGCPAEFEKKDLKAHQENCERHPGRTMDAVCPFTECQKLLAIGDLDNHLSRSHHEFYMTSATSKYQIKISKRAIESSNYDRKKVKLDQSWNFLFIICLVQLLFWKCPESGYVFYPQLVQRNNVWHFWVAVKAGPHIAKQFRFVNSSSFRKIISFNIVEY